MNSVKGDGSFGNKDQSYLEFNGVAVVADQACPQRMFFCPTDCLTLFVLSEMEFADEGGSMLFQQIGTDSFEVRMRYFANLFNKQPAAFGVVRNYLSP